MAIIKKPVERSIQERLYFVFFVRLKATTAPVNCNIIAIISDKNVIILSFLQSIIMIVNNNILPLYFFISLKYFMNCTLSKEAELIACDWLKVPFKSDILLNSFNSIH